MCDAFVRLHVLWIALVLVFIYSKVLFWPVHPNERIMQYICRKSDGFLELGANRLHANLVPEVRIVENPARIGGPPVFERSGPSTPSRTRLVVPTP
eukprot:COSAG02_NODE_710_length_18178_cov_14.361524_2_plen_96_part_00